MKEAEPPSESPAGVLFVRISCDCKLLISDVFCKSGLQVHEKVGITLSSFENKGVKVKDRRKVHEDESKARNFDSKKQRALQIGRPLYSRIAN